MRTRRSAFAGLALAAALALTACAQQQPEDTTAADARTSTSAGSEGTTTARPSGASGASSTGSASADGAAPAADGPVDAEHNEADMTFAHMMIPHHEQAVRMGEMLEEKDGVPPEVRDLAVRIKDEQAPEVRRLNEMLDAWGSGGAAAGQASGSASAGHAGHGDGSGRDADGAMSGHAGMEMDGMLSQTQMRQIEVADGADAAHLYVSHMIGHHRGAIAMAEAELRDGTNPQALALATQIVETQESEVQELMALPQAK